MVCPDKRTVLFKKSSIIYFVEKYSSIEVSNRRTSFGV